MKKILVLLVLFTVPGIAQAMTYTFAVIDHPDAQSNRMLTAINDNGIVGGYYYATEGHSFWYDGQSFTVFDFPGGTYTKITGVNDRGDFVGRCTIDNQTQSYLYQDGTSSMFQVPDSSETFLEDVNNNRVLTGNATGLIPLPSNNIAFVYDGVTLEEMAIDGAFFVSADSLNNSDILAGRYLDINNNWYLFIRSGESVIFRDFSTMISLEVEAINDWNSVAGSLEDETGWKVFVDYGYSVSTFNFPGADYTKATDMNNAGQVVGYYVVNGMSHGFLASPYYMDSDQDLDTDGQDLSRLQAAISQGASDMEDLVNFAQNFGRKQYFTNQAGGN